MHASPLRKPSASAIAALVLAMSSVSWPVLAQPGPLDRPEFSKEITLKVDGLDIHSTYRAIGQLVNVAFILDDVPRNRTVKVHLSADNMVCRGILESLANSYELEYSSSEVGVIVRRRGSTASGSVRGEARPKGEALTYWFDVALRDASGRELPFRRFERRYRLIQPLPFSILGRDDKRIPFVHPKLGSIDSRHVGGFEMLLGVTRDLGTSLSVVAELITYQTVDASRYTATHAFKTATATAGDLLLFRMDDGDEVILKNWGRVPPAADAPQAP